MRKYLDINKPGDALYHLKEELKRRTQYYWTTKDGQTINIQDMSDAHLKNTIKYLENYEYEYDMASSCDVDEIMFGD